MLLGTVAQSRSHESPPESCAGLDQEMPNDTCMDIVQDGQCNSTLQSDVLKS